MIKAVLFDIDGVLIDSFEANREFFARLIGKFGLAQNLPQNPLEKYL